MEEHITTNAGNSYTFYSINNDYNGNPRYVVHYTDLLSDLERNVLTVLDGFELAQKRASFKYHGLKYGGMVGIDGTQVYNLHHAAELLDEKKNHVLALSKSGNLDRLCDEIYSHICFALEDDRDYMETIKHLYKYPRVVWGGEDFYDTGLRYIVDGEFLIYTEQQRAFLIECGYKAEKWTCDRIIIKLAEAANMVLSYIYTHFTI